MRFINKSSRCPEFDNYINENAEYLSSQGEWNLQTDIKEKLHNHILEQQKGLCIYCEQQLSKKTGAEYLPDAIIEHIRPRTNSKYPELTYIFCNLSVACKKHIDKKGIKNNDKANISTPEAIDFCEDRKDKEYNEQLFLNPHEVEDIESYFEYDTEGRIFPKNDNEKAKYMIEKALNLAHTKLINMRKEQYLIFSESPIEETDDLLNENAEQLPAFYSMLKQLFTK